jgi:hypothetical protein
MQAGGNRHTECDADGISLRPLSSRSLMSRRSADGVGLGHSPAYAVPSTTLLSCP